MADCLLHTHILLRTTLNAIQNVWNIVTPAAALSRARDSTQPSETERQQTLEMYQRNHEVVCDLERKLRVIV